MLPRLLAFRLTLPHTGVPRVPGRPSTACVHDPWALSRHEENRLWRELRWIWRIKTTCK